VIRAAVVDDAEALERVRVRAWHRAYGDFIDPDRIEAVTGDEWVPVWRERLSGSATQTWVWDQDGLIAGFASAGPGTSGDPPELGCLYALYVDPLAQGAGVGAALLEHAEAALRSMGFAEAVLWVFSENEHGRRFYEARGWALDAAEPEVLGEWAAPGLRYRRRL
jgi:GNAT superfamily N-acetyltransferase